MASFPIKTQKLCDRRKTLCGVSLNRGGRASLSRRGGACFRRNLCGAGVAAVVLAGCNSSEAPTGVLTSGTLDLGIPEKIRQVSAVDLDAVTAIANVNSVDYPMTRNGDRFQTTITLEPVASVAVNLRFSETLESGYVLSLARHSQQTQQVDSNNITMQFFEADFDTNFDDDGDSITNLQERELGTDPTVFSPVDDDRELTLTFSLPPNMPNPAVTQSIVTFGGVPRARTRNGDDFTVTGDIGTTTNVAIEVRLTQLVSTGRAVLAIATTSVAAGVDDLTLALTDSDFDFSRDDDGDGETNIEEVSNGTDPFSAN